MAEQIAAAAGDHQVVSLSAADLTGTELLPAEVYFFGCAEPHPVSFAYLAEVLRHINLVGRACGLFAPQSQGALHYLSDMVHDSEITLNLSPLTADTPEPRQWVQDVISLLRHNGGDTMEQDFNLDACIRKVPDFPKKGILFYDITGILTKPQAFAYCIERMVELYQDKQIDAVAAIEARGFVFAAPFALRLGIPLILIRKKGKLPGKTFSRTYQLEYADATIEIHTEDVPAGKRVLLLDDLIATGGTLKAAWELITACGGVVPEIFGVIGLPFLDYEKVLGDIPVQTLISYHAE
jgi:adenine phosphoribosyltransferase